MSRRRQLLRGGRKDALVANVGDIAYKATDGSIKVIAPDAWNSALGVTLGVVVIPSGFAPDGKARIVSLYWAGYEGGAQTSAGFLYWATVSSDTSLANYNRIPITDNKGLTTTGSNTMGYMPSDSTLTGTTSYVDPTTKYRASSNLIPSPYLGDKPNPAYYAPISGYNNALADFNGKGNTDVLVALGTGYYAANAARNYKAAGAEEIEWYLPAMGELGYLEVRFKKINEALTQVGATQLTFTYYWSSTEKDHLYAFYLDNSLDLVSYNYDKGNKKAVRPFAQLDF